MNNWLKKVVFASGLLCSAVTFASPINIINGGFEGIGINGWFTEPGPLSPYVANQLTQHGTRYTAAEGNQFAVLPANSSIRSETNWQAGDTISFKWLALDAIDPTFQIYEEDLAVTKTLGLIGDAGVWHEFSYTFQDSVNPNLPSFVGFQGFSKGGPDALLLVDDVKITRIPVPATLGLALLGIGLMARQRHNRKNTA
ncbi:hypothetical protein [Spartinivicinus ruber]|uniref:hypothetical protein n=1 Tax=Spartinivicinus ruber TaxID=2683272 RepID=UPI0013D29FD1|nr:hypothetical protein [Spartinivicinus ruber]